MSRAEKIDLSGSHLPVLARLILSTSGAVMELGAGFNSTPFLYWMCKADGRLFRSYENDKAWCEKLTNFTLFIDDWDKLDLENIFWSVVLIDHRPAIRRHKDAIRFKTQALFVVLHDSEPEIDRFYAYRRVYPHFQYRYDFKRLIPNTTVLSNYVDPRQVFDRK
jgi:hypothetical protein